MILLSAPTRDIFFALAWKKVFLVVSDSSKKAPGGCDSRHLYRVISHVVDRLISCMCYSRRHQIR